MERAVRVMARCSLDWGSLLLTETWVQGKGRPLDCRQLQVLSELRRAEERISLEAAVWEMRVSKENAGL